VLINNSKHHLREIKYFPARTPAYLCWIKTRNTFRAKWWNTFICSRKAASLSWIWCTNMTRKLKIFDLQTICSKYRPETWFAPSALALNIQPICAENCLETRRATNDVVRIFHFDIQLNCAENVIQTWLAPNQERPYWRSICDK